MRIIVFSGSHARHLYVHQAVVDYANEYAVVLMEREQLIPEVPTNIPEIDQRNFTRHFSERHEIESAAYGDIYPDDVFSKCQIHRCLPQTLNSADTVNFVKDFGADMAFIFGTDLIKEPVLSILPKIKINLHLGLSPWYKGSATLFWPFYFMQPQFSGATFHQILPEADAGGILHQTVPILQMGDGIHDVGAKVVIEAKKDLIKLLKGCAQFGWDFDEQTTTGRLFLTRDFQPAHLRLIYNTYQNNIVDHFLAGQLEGRMPKLIKSKHV